MDCRLLRRRVPAAAARSGRQGGSGIHDEDSRMRHRIAPCRAAARALLIAHVPAGRNAVSRHSTLPRSHGHIQASVPGSGIWAALGVPHPDAAFSGGPVAAAGRDCSGGGLAGPWCLARGTSRRLRLKGRRRRPATSRTGESGTGVFSTAQAAEHAENGAAVSACPPSEDWFREHESAFGAIMSPFAWRFSPRLPSQSIQRPLPRPPRRSCRRSSGRSPGRSRARRSA